MHRSSAVGAVTVSTSHLKLAARVANSRNANAQLFATQTRLSKQDQLAPMDICLSRSKNWRGGIPCQTFPHKPPHRLSLPTLVGGNNWNCENKREETTIQKEVHLVRGCAH